MIERLLDATGVAIVAALQEEARLTYHALGRRVGLSPPAVAERVRRLEEAGIITGYRATVDRAKLGWPITVFVQIVTAVEQGPRFATAVRAMPEVLECHRVTGGDSFILKACVASTGHLERFLDQLTPYGTSTTAVVLSSPLERHVIGVRDDDPAALPDPR